MYHILFVIYFRFAKKDQGILARILELKCITKMFNVYLNLIIFLFLGPQNYKNEFLGWLVPKKSRICLKIWKSFAGPRCGKLRPNFESCSEQGTQTYWGTSVDHTGRSRHWFVSFVYDIFEHQRSHSGISSWHLFQVW